MGRQRGGLGQTIEIGLGEQAPFVMSAGTCDRVVFPARGRVGGGPGATGRFGLSSGTVFDGKKRHTVPEGERLLLELPGGGGYGAPDMRPVEQVAQDVRLGLVSPEAARRDYAVVLDDAGAVNGQATAKLRAKAG